MQVSKTSLFVYSSYLCSNNGTYKLLVFRMSSDRNNETRDAVKREIKDIQARCKHECYVIANCPLEAPTVTSEQINEKTLCYIEGLGTQIQNSHTPITADDNILTSQFLKEIKDKTKQVEDYTAFMRGSINDINAEINR